jgi:hypothetical protein
MSIEVHIDWQGATHLAGRLHAAERSASVSFEYAEGWLQRDDAFAIDPTSLPLQLGAQHAKGLFGAIQDCGHRRITTFQPPEGVAPDKQSRGMSLVEMPRLRRASARSRPSLRSA